MLDKTKIGSLTLTKLLQSHFKIMEEAVAKWHSIQLKMIGQLVASLVDSGSTVSLMWQDCFNRYFRP